MNRSRRKAVAASTIAAALLAVGTIGVAAQDASPSAAAESAKVRVLHASPDAPAVDVYANGNAILQDVPFGAISDYLEVPAGEYQIQVFAAGADPASATAVIDATLPFEAGTATTVAATNSLANIEAQVLPDAPAPVADAAQVRVVHFSADAPAVDIAVDGGDVVVSDLAYPDATDYLSLPAGEYDLEIRPTGTTDVAFDLDPLGVEAGTSYSVFAIGSLADGTFQVLPTVDATLAPAVATAKVRVLHGSPDAPAVDVYANGALALQNVPFGAISDYLEVPADTDIQFQVFATGADPAADSPVIDATLSFAPGSMTTVAATGALAQITPQVIADAPAPAADAAQVRVVHLSADAPAVDIAQDGKKKALIKGLAYPEATAYLSLPAGEYDLEVRPAGKKKAAFDIDPLTLAAGTSYSAFAIGSLADGTFTVLPVVDATAQ